MRLPSIMERELAPCMLLRRQVLGNSPRCVRNPQDDTKGFCCIKSTEAPGESDLDNGPGPRAHQGKVGWPLLCEWLLLTLAHLLAASVSCTRF